MVEGNLGVLERLAEAEVGEGKVSVSPQQPVVWLHVAVRVPGV